MIQLKSNDINSKSGDFPQQQWGIFPQQNGNL